MGFGKDGRGVIIHGHSGPVALTTLGAKTSIQIASFPATEDFRLLKLESHFIGLGFTPADDSVIIGLADGELSQAEIVECIDADGPLDRNDNLARERAERPVWILPGILPSMPATASPAEGYFFNEWTKRWTFSNPEGFQFFAFNPDSDALTTGSTIVTIFTGYGLWLS